MDRGAWQATFQGATKSHTRLSEFHFEASLIAQSVKNMPAVQETRVRFLRWEDPLEKEMATHSSILAWEIPWTEGALRATVRRGHKESDTTYRLNNNNNIIYRDQRSNCQHLLDHRKSKTVPEKHLLQLY